MGQEKLSGLNFQLCLIHLYNSCFSKASIFLLIDLREIFFEILGRGGGGGRKKN